jgi:hypothetical protein
VVALGTLASFFVAPYARHYDFPVLLIPLLVLLGGRLPKLPGRLVLLAVVLLPYLQVVLMARFKEQYDPSGKFLPEGTFFWVPVVLTLAWLIPWQGRPQTVTHQTG